MVEDQNKMGPTSGWVKLNATLIRSCFNAGQVS